MLRENVKIIRASLFIVDIVVTILAFFLAYYIRSQHFTAIELRPLLPLDAYLWLLLVIVPVWTFLLHYFNAYKSYRTIPFSGEFKVILKTVLIGTIILGSIVFASKFIHLSRTFIAIFFVINILMLSVERWFVRYLSHSARSRGYNYRNVIIVGSGQAAQNFSKVLRSEEAWGLRLLGFVTDESSDIKTSVLGSISELEKIVKENVVDEVIFAVTRKRLTDLEDTFLMLEEHGINARMLVDFFPHVRAKVHLDAVGSVQLLTFTTVPSNSFALALKRIFDVITSLFIFILSSPVLVVTMLLIKVTSKGDIFFKQRRSGVNGRTFTLYKFRSMVVDAEAKKAGLLEKNEMDGPVFKVKNDPRVTPFGRFIRKTSLDEFPQLWNVLRGDMSMVGPRPPLPSEVNEYARWQRRRLSMKPGLTCLWQVSGRNKVSNFDDWVRLDLKYIDEWSLWLDLKIFLKTFPVVLFGRGAM